MKAKLCFSILLALLLWTPYTGAGTLDDIVSCWRFDEGQGTIAYDSVGDNHGSILGPIWTTGQFGSALSFDDMDDYVEVQDDHSLRFTQYDSFSFCFWANPSAGGYVFSKLNAYPQSGIFGYALRWLSGTSKFQFMTQKSGVNNVFVDTSDNSAPAGSWYFVTAVYDKKDMIIYLNAELKGTNFFSYDTGSTSPDNNFAIGVRLLPSILEQYFGGMIDDMIVFKKALSAEEIQQLYLYGVNNIDFAVIQIKKALYEKVKALEKIDAALLQEWAAYENLEELLESGDYGGLQKSDIVHAMQQIHSSIKQEELSKKAIEKSIEKLLSSLSALGYGLQPPGSNWPPEVTIITPQNGDEFTPDETIEIEADALDYNGSVVMVEFYANGSKIAEDTDGSNGWTTSWHDHPEGTYSLTAKATDNEAATTTSAEVVIIVEEETPPIPPFPPIPPPIP